MMKRGEVTESLEKIARDTPERDGDLDELDASADAYSELDSHWARAIMTRMKRRGLGLGFACAVMCAVIGAEGCDSEVSETPPTTSSTSNAGGGGSGASGASGGSGGIGGAGGTGGALPSSCEPIDGVAVVASHLYLGDTDRDDQPSASAWTTYGFDIDGLTTTPQDLAGHCQPSSGANPSVLTDGDDGRDNAFGRSIMPLFLSLQSDFSQQANQAITSGAASSLLIKIDGLSSPDLSPAPSRVYGAAPLLHAPAFDGSDCWPVAYESLSDPVDPDTALAIFTNATVSSGLWESVDAGEVTIILGLPGFISITLPLHHTKLSMQIDGGLGGATLGQIGGVVTTADLEEQVRQLAGSFDPGLCTGSTVESILAQIRQASDIMADGTQDENSTCDGISVGFGFDAAAVAFGAIAAPSRPVPGPCD